MAKLIIKSVVLLFVLYALGVLCEGCNSGYYADTVKCLPCPEKCTACSSASSCDSCSVGYYGESCSQVCPNNCHDNECNKTSGLCIACSKGHYSGDNRSCIKCPENCTTCNSPQYCFACKRGYKGKACEDKCTTCRPGTSCDKQTGYCLESCSAGRSGDLCTIKCDDKCTFCERSNEKRCISCAHSRYGDSCNKICSQTCLNQTCRDSDGECIYAEMKENPPTYKDNLSSGITTTVIIFGLLELIFVVVIIGFRIVFRKRISKYTACKWCHKIADQLLSLYRSLTHKVESKQPESKPLALEETTEIMMEYPKQQSADKQHLGFEEEDSPIVDLKEHRRRKIPCKTIENKVKSETHEREPLTTEVTDNAEISPKQHSPIEVHVDVRQHVVGGDIVEQSKPRRGNLTGKTFKNKGDDLMKQGTSLDTDGQFITRYARKLDYMVSVEPIDSILKDVSTFWKVLWVDSCRKIVMLTSVLEVEDVYKFDHYILCREEHQDFDITCNSGSNYDDYFVRTLTVREKTDITTDGREVTLFRYVIWPEKWDQENFLRLIEFFKCVNSVQTDHDGPILVHSSARVHRCATYIAADLLTKDGKEKSPDDVNACLQHLNRQKLHTNREDTEFLTQIMDHLPSLAKPLQESESRKKLETNVVSFKKN